MHKAWVYMVALAVLAGCGGETPKQGSDQVMEQFYQQLSRGEFDKAMAHYDNAFFSRQSKEHWLQQLKERGVLRQYKKTNKQTSTRFSGTFVIYQLDTNYDKGAFREVLTIFLGLKSDRFTITGHKITPKT